MLGWIHNSLILSHKICKSNKFSFLWINRDFHLKIIRIQMLIFKVKIWHFSHLWIHRRECKYWWKQRLNFWVACRTTLERKLRILDKCKYNALYNSKNWKKNAIWWHRVDDWREIFQMQFIQQLIKNNLLQSMMKLPNSSLMESSSKSLSLDYQD